MRHRRRRHSSPAPALPLEDVLLRLPPLPSALPRSSLVCKRWRGILSDPRFLGRYRRHHRRPPLLGFMTRWEYGMRLEFVPLPRKKPDRIPPARFAVPKSCTLHGVCAESMGWMELLKPVAAMIAFDTLFAVMTVLVKKALDGGLNHVVLIALRQLVGAAFLAPIAYFKERNARPRFTKEIFAYLFMSALLGALFAQYLFFLGLSYTTATLAATVSNMTPVFTFLIAIPLRSETVDVRSKAGLAKIAGTLASVGGAILLSLYKGAALTHTASSTQEHAGNGTTGTSGSKGRWLLGSALLLLNCITFSFWMLLQGKLTKKYPAVISSTAFMALLSSLQAGALAVTTQRHLSVWLLRGSIQIATVLFAGVGVSGIGYVLMTWCIEQRGPVFTAGFLPLIQIIAGVLDLLVLHEQLYVGSVVGAAFVIGGLYLLLWGKSKDASSAAVLSEKGLEEDKETQENL